MAMGKRQQVTLALLTAAIQNGDVAIIEVRDNKTGELCDAICALVSDEQQSPGRIVPLAFMVRENPYERFDPPVEGEEHAPAGKRPIGFVH